MPKAACNGLASVRCKADGCARVLRVIFSATILLFVVTLGPFGSVTECYAGGLKDFSIRGWKPFNRPIPDKPLDGAKQAIHDTGQAVGKAATVVWRAVTRPFVETWKFLKDPLAGLRRKINEWTAAGVAFAWRIVAWIGIGAGFTISFFIFLGIAVATFFYRLNQKQKRVSSLSRP